MSNNLRGDHKLPIEVVKEAWKAGIEIYYIGLHISQEQIVEAESLLGKGHVTTVTDVATELPKLLETIVGRTERDLVTLAKGGGF